VKSIFVHLPAYREPELVPTIESALKNAKYPQRIHFGICRQYHPDDHFDNVDKYRKDKRFKIHDMLYTEAKGLATARAIINDELLEDQDFVCQLDSHHRFDKNWDDTLIRWYNTLKKDGYNPVIGGYLPYYNPFNDPAERVHEPWFSSAACFYPHGTIFIQPTGVKGGWKHLKKPYPSRFLSGHFAFSCNQWARDVKHDKNIFFAGEELNLTLRSFTHGYDLFHPHRVVIWHATMREERAGKLVWDDQSKRGDSSWWKGNDSARARMRQLIGIEDNGIDFGEYGLGSKRSLRDYEKYAGIHFQKQAFQNHTINHLPPPNPIEYKSEKEWEDSFTSSFYHLVNLERHEMPADDYESILIAFDDKNGASVNSKSISGPMLDDFLKFGKSIHYEEKFLTNTKPHRVVYWGYSKGRGWAERVERAIT
jgi:hypothetical protein